MENVTLKPTKITLKDGTKIELRKSKNYSAILSINDDEEVHFWIDGEYDGRCTALKECPGGK